MGPSGTTPFAPDGAHWDEIDPATGQAFVGGGRTYRVATCLMYLADVEEGGETSFPRGKWIDEAVQTAGKTYSDCGAKGIAVHPKKGEAGRGALLRRMCPLAAAGAGSCRTCAAPSAKRCATGALARAQSCIFSVLAGLPLLQETQYSFMTCWSATKWIHWEQVGWSPYQRTKSAEELEKEERAHVASQERWRLQREADAADPCHDSDPSCEGWAWEGECERNAGFMDDSCPRSCDLCCAEGDAACELRRAERRQARAQVAAAPAAGEQAKEAAAALLTDEGEDRAEEAAASLRAIHCAMRLLRQSDLHSRVRRRVSTKQDERDLPTLADFVAQLPMLVAQLYSLNAEGQTEHGSSHVGAGPGPGTNGQLLHAEPSDLYALGLALAEHVVLSELAQPPAVGTSASGQVAPEQRRAAIMRALVLLLEGGQEAGAEACELRPGGEGELVRLLAGAVALYLSRSRAASPGLQHPLLQQQQHADASRDISSAFVEAGQLVGLLSKAVAAIQACTGPAAEAVEAVVAFLQPRVRAYLQQQQQHAPLQARGFDERRLEWVLQRIRGSDSIVCRCLREKAAREAAELRAKNAAEKLAACRAELTAVRGELTRMRQGMTLAAVELAEGAPPVSSHDGREQPQEAADGLAVRGGSVSAGQTWRAQSGSEAGAEQQDDGYGVAPGDDHLAGLAGVAAWERAAAPLHPKPEPAEERQPERAPRPPSRRKRKPSAPRHALSDDSELAAIVQEADSDDSSDGFMQGFVQGSGEGDEEEEDSDYMPSGEEEDVQLPGHSHKGGGRRKRSRVLVAALTAAGAAPEDLAVGTAPKRARIGPKLETLLDQAKRALHHRPAALKTAEGGLKLDESIGAYFAEEPTDEVAEGYSSIVARPIALLTIQRRLAGGEYASDADLLADFELMFANCHAYNRDAALAGFAVSVYLVNEAIPEMERLLFSYWRRYQIGPSITSMRVSRHDSFEPADAIKKARHAAGQSGAGVAVMLDLIPSTKELMDVVMAVREQGRLVPKNGRMLAPTLAAFLEAITAGDPTSGFPATGNPVILAYREQTLQVLQDLFVWLLPTSSLPPATSPEEVRERRRQVRAAVYTAAPIDQSFDVVVNRRRLHELGLFPEAWEVPLELPKVAAANAAAAKQQAGQRVQQPTPAAGAGTGGQRQQAAARQESLALLRALIAAKVKPPPLPHPTGDQDEARQAQAGQSGSPHNVLSPMSVPSPTDGSGQQPAPGSTPGSAGAVASGGKEPWKLPRDVRHAIYDHLVGVVGEGSTRTSAARAAVQDVCALFPVGSGSDAEAVARIYKQQRKKRHKEAAEAGAAGGPGAGAADNAGLPEAAAPEVAAPVEQAAVVDPATAAEQVATPESAAPVQPAVEAAEPAVLVEHAAVPKPGVASDVPASAEATPAPPAPTEAQAAAAEVKMVAEHAEVAAEHAEVAAEHAEVAAEHAEVTALALQAEQAPAPVAAGAEGGERATLDFEGGEPMLIDEVGAAEPVADGLELGQQREERAREPAAGESEAGHGWAEYQGQEIN
eukprot:scaffold6.g2773.t1